MVRGTIYRGTTVHLVELISMIMLLNTRKDHIVYIVPPESYQFHVDFLVVLHS